MQLIVVRVPPQALCQIHLSGLETCMCVFVQDEGQKLFMEGQVELLLFLKKKQAVNKSHFSTTYLPFNVSGV